MPDSYGAPLWFWILFTAFVLAMLSLDLFVFHRRPHAVSGRESLGWVSFWIALAAVFCVIVWHWHGGEAALLFITGYVVEYSLSVDNIFVFLLLFSYFQVPAEYQHRVLFWGIIGALVLRAVLILTGIALIQMFHWVLYVFGAILIYTAIKLAFSPEREVHPERNPVLRYIRKVVPVTKDYVKGHFFVTHLGRLHATPLFVTVVVVELTDLMFAFDSIPAILAITQDSFIVFTSNIFAILGLRSLYFALAKLMRLFRFLSYGLAFILFFIGVKLCIAEWVKIPILLSLSVIALSLTISILASLLIPGHKQEPQIPAFPDDDEAPRAG